MSDEPLEDDGLDLFGPGDEEELSALFGEPEPIAPGIAVAGPPMTVERLKELARKAHYLRPDYQCLYGRLNLQGHRHEIVWDLERVFRPSDLLFWGQGHDTVIESFRLGDGEHAEQIVGELPVAYALVNPYPLKQVLEDFVDKPEGDVLSAVRLKQKLRKANDGINFATVEGGQKMTLVVRGPLAHVLVLGASVEVP